MPASSNSAHANPKRPRKKPRPAQVISPETWKAVEAAICIGGLGYSETGRRFGIEPHAILMRARRYGWAVASKIAERTQALQACYKACESDRNGNDLAIQVVAESWAERGEQHRLLAFQLAHNSLKTAAKRGLPIKDWRAADLADRTARRNAGLDSGEGTRVSIGMALINDRLEVLAETLPKEVD